MRHLKRVYVTLAVLALCLPAAAQEMKEAVALYNEAAQSYKANSASAIDQIGRCIEACAALGTDESADLKGRAERLLPLAHFEYASSLYKQKKFQECLGQMEKAKAAAQAVADKGTVQKVDRIVPKIYYSEGLNAMKAGQYAEATGLMQKAVDIDTRNLDAFVAMAICYDSLCQPASMLATVERGLEVARSTNNMARQLDLQSMAINYLKVEGQRAEEAKMLDSAIAIYGRAIQIDPREADVYSALAVCYSKQGNHEKVIECTNLGIEHAPGTMDKTQFYFLRAKSQAATGDRDGACASYAEAAHGAYKEAAEHEMKEVLKCK